MDVYEIKKEYLDKCLEQKNIFKYNLDFLRTVIDHSTKYNNIILNPPFIRLQNLSIEDRDFIKTTYPILKKRKYRYILRLPSQMFGSSK